MSIKTLVVEVSFVVGPTLENSSVPTYTEVSRSVATGPARVKRKGKKSHGSLLELIQAAVSV